MIKTKKEFLEKIVNGLPYVILFTLSLAVLVFIFLYGVSYQQLLDLIKVLIWPSIVLCALIFFRKVFTYLFFSMDEFNFFGNKGSLKNIQEVIDERVQRIVEEEKQTRKNEEIVISISQELEEAKLSQKNSDKQATENLELAKDIFTKYKTLSKENNELLKELTPLRQEKEEREARRKYMRQLIDREKEKTKLDSMPSSEELKAAGEAYMQQNFDSERGK